MTKKGNKGKFEEEKGEEAPPPKKVTKNLSEEEKGKKKAKLKADMSHFMSELEKR